MATMFLFVLTVAAIAMAVSNGISKFDELKKHGCSFTVEAESLVFK